MRKLFAFLIGTIIFLTQSSCVLAENNPLLSPNNKFGIHIFSEKDLSDAAKLVNSNGDWGYVTLVITEGERDHDRFQQVFDQMRRLHLIPIIRIASKANGDTWEIPNEAEINNWIAFLNSLNWVVENRYVIIANEPNHAAEWGGKLDPEGYAKYLKTFSQKLKEASPDFFVLPAALDASANNSKKTMEESKYLKNMIKTEPEVFNYVDGWNSHSYPNPAFSGKETDKGKGTIDTFNWEIAYLKSLGVTKELPIFITETGWSSEHLSEEEIASKFTYAFKNVWNDSRIVAVTPFILNYTNPPFKQFSWKKEDGSFYKYFDSIKVLSKELGAPKQIVKGDIVAALAQPIIPQGSEYISLILARNTGQSIWNNKDILVGSESTESGIRSPSFQEIEPTKLGLIIFKAASPEKTGIYSDSVFLKNQKNERITNSFPIEGYVVKIDQNKLNDLWSKIQNYVRGVLKI